VTFLNGRPTHGHDYGTLNSREFIALPSSPKRIDESHSMKINPDEVIAWLIVGALAGSLAGMIVKRHRAGFGRILNLAVGLIGAVIGGVVFKMLHINLGVVGSITITSEEVVEAFLGALLFLAVVWFVRKMRTTKNTTISHAE
jgi:uncharacterized membrane protein YeaQ/YmgE (transglycosylase-associated protein family)